MMVMINSTIMINRNHINGFNNCNVRRRSRRAVEPAAVQFPTFMYGGRMDSSGDGGGGS